MPPIDVEEEDDQVDFQEPDPGAAGFHTISLDAPVISSHAAPFSFIGKMAEPVEPTSADFTTPPARKASVRPMSSQEGGCQTCFPKQNWGYQRLPIIITNVSHTIIFVSSRSML